ncbi:cytochrome P450 [Flagelloscypha sp. PMI_526]|nr:cytochrome P450 [Flagelloscypha sp. PMI_526]
MLNALEAVPVIPLTALVVSLSILSWAPWKKSSVPTYGQWYIPPFLRGLRAMVSLGQDEDKFLLSLYHNYGPIVYIPWPMSQYTLTASRAINNFYSSSQLQFPPIRLEMQEDVFGVGKHHPHSMFLERFYPMHGKGLTKGRLRGPVERFNQIFAERVRALADQVHDSASGYLDISIVDWVMATMFDAGLGAMYGMEFVRLARARSPKTVSSGHYGFDEIFPILASGMVPSFLWNWIKPIKEGIVARDDTSRALQEFVEMGTPGLEDGITKDTVEFMQSEGISPKDMGPLLLGDLWASQANAPPACVALFLRAFQTPGCVERLREEIKEANLFIGGGVDYTSLNDSVPFVTSCVNETLRTETSSFSIRIAKEDCLLDVSTDASEKKLVPIPKNAKVIAATRVPHITDEVWGDDPEAWNPTRFLPKGEGEAANVGLAKLLKEMRGFGGGVSMCEGRHLATHELKSALALFATTFDMEPVIAPGSEGEYARFKIHGEKHLGFAPKKNMTRPGMGAFQFEGDLKMRVRLYE